MIYKRPTRYCEDCGKELIYITGQKQGSGYGEGGRLIACDYDGPVPYWEDPNGTQRVATRDGRVVRCELSGDPENVTGTAYLVHRCGK